ncbi:hypothetical protein BDL97_07G096000, partial [Sphagnum fallax]
DREYRKGNWTLRETVVLIAAKKRDEDRRLKGGEKEKSNPAELRWKWVENYSGKNGCQRSQNRFRDYELRSTAAAADPRHREQPMISSYWQMEKHERKEKGLPSNLLKQVYQALHDVIDRRFPPPASKLPQSDFPVPALPSTSMRPAATSPRTAAAGGEVIAPAMFKSTVEITQRLLACEDKKDKRHRDLLGVEELKLHIEEVETEISRAGVAGLITTVNNLASAILALAGDKSAAGDTSS